VKRKPSFPLPWGLLLAMWLVLTGAVAVADVLLGGLVAVAGVLALAAVETPQARRLKVRPALGLLTVVLADVVRSNLAVAWIVLRPEKRRRKAGFVTIPLRLRNPRGLAVLACIITSTPGTAWAGYDSTAGVLTMHVLDLIDESEWRSIIRDRYESRLVEMFE
jgi:multicomponent K+:H+ antiporter subunit E